MPGQNVDSCFRKGACPARTRPAGGPAPREPARDSIARPKPLLSAPFWRSTRRGFLRPRPDPFRARGSLKTRPSGSTRPLPGLPHRRFRHLRRPPNLPNPPNPPRCPYGTGGPWASCCRRRRSPSPTTPTAAASAASDLPAALAVPRAVFTPVLASAAATGVQHRAAARPRLYSSHIPSSRAAAPFPSLPQPPPASATSAVILHPAACAAPRRLRLSESRPSLLWLGEPCAVGLIASGGGHCPPPP